MTSARKVAANHTNGRKSLGPRTRAGKARSSQNALRHGLARFPIEDPARFEQLTELAKAICPDYNNELLWEQSLLIAETELLLRCVHAQRVALIERLRDADTTALAARDNSLALAKARFLATKLAYAELEKIRAFVDQVESEGKDATQEVLAEPMLSAWKPREMKERDECDALMEAIPDLQRLLRYERRAWSRRKRAIREFIAIRTTAQ